MAINFPDNPTSGQTYTYNDISWSWNGSAWEKAIGNNVNLLNGLTGALSLLASTGISIAAGGKGITFTNTGVQSFNGLTGAVTGVTQINAGSNITVTGTTNPTIGVTSNPSFRTITGIDGSGDVSSLLTLGTVAQSIPQFAPVISSNAALYLNGTSNSLGLSAGSANFSGAVSCLAGVTVAGNIRVSGNYLGTVTNTVNGTTGAVLISGDNGISITTSGKTSTVTNIGVTSLNGATGTLENVASLNGLTGIVSVLASTGISVAAGGKGITFTNTGVQSFNGLTGAVTGVTVGGANIFTALNSFNSGISSAGGTFSALTRFNAGISSAGGTFSANTVFSSGLQTDSVLSTTGVGGTLYLNSNSDGGGGNSITYIGDWLNDNNGTSITVDDQTALITLNSNVSTTIISTQTITASSSVVVGAAAATIETATITLGTTAANQTISTTSVYDGGTSLDVNRTIEFLVQASTSSAYEALKIIAIHDGTNTYNTQYGLIRSGSSLCSSYTTTLATVAGGSKVLRLRATPTNTNTTFKVVEIIIPA